jgi:hypothetical protein
MSDRPKSSKSKTKSRSKKRKDLKDKRDCIPKDDHSNSGKREREKARLKEKRRNERKKDSQSPRSPRTGNKHREDVIRSDCKEVGGRVSNSKHEKGKYNVVEAPSQEGNKMRVKASKKNREKKRQLDSDTNYEKGKNDCRHLDPQSPLVSKSHDKTKEISAIPKCSLDVNVLSQLKSSGGGGGVKAETGNLKKVEKKEKKVSSNCRNREEDKRLKRDNKTKKREDKKTISSPFDRMSKENSKGRKDETLPTNGEKHDKRQKKDHVEKENQALKRDQHEDRLQEKDIPKYQGGSQTQMPNCSLDTNVLSQIKHNGGKAKESVSKKKSKASTNKKKPVKSVSQEKSKEATSKKKSKESTSGKKSKESESKKRAKVSRDKQNESAFKIRNIWLCVFARKTKKDKAKSNMSTETKKHIDKTEPNSISSKDKPSKRKTDKHPAKGDDGIHRDGKRRKPVKTDKMSKSMEGVKKSSSMNSRKNKKDPKKGGASSSKKNASLTQYKNGKIGRTRPPPPPPPPPPPKRQRNNTRKHDQDHVQGEKKLALPRNDEVRKRRAKNTSDSSNKEDMIIPSSSLSSAVLRGIKGVDKSKLSKVQPNSQSNPKTTPVKKSSLAHSVLSDISSGVANLKHPSSVENTKNQEPFNLFSQIKAGKQLKEVSQEEIKQKKKQSDKPISILSQIKQGKQLKHVSQRDIINDGSDEEEYG